MRTPKSRLVAKAVVMLVAMALVMANDALAQRGGGRGGGGGARGGGGQGGGRQMSGGGPSRGGGGPARGGGNYARGGGGRPVSPGNSINRGGRGGQVRTDGGFYRGGNVSNGRNGSGPNNWNRNYGNFNGPRNPSLNGLDRIYAGNYGYGGYPYGGFRYGTGYRGYGGLTYGRFGLGSAFGPYGYGYFPWYGGLGLYGGLAGLSRVFGNGIYGSGYYNNGYNTGYAGNGGTTVYVQPELTAQPEQPVEDYVPQVNTTSAQLAMGAAGNAVLGVTMDPQYPNAAVVRTVTPGSPAEIAGLRPGDMIASLNGRIIQSPDDVVNLIGVMRPNDQVDMQFVRPIPRSQVQAAAPEVQPGATATAPTNTEVLPTGPPALPAPPVE